MIVLFRYRALGLLKIPAMKSPRWSCCLRMSPTRSNRTNIDHWAWIWWWVSYLWLHRVTINPSSCEETANFNLLELLLSNKKSATDTAKRPSQTLKLIFWFLLHFQWISPDYPILLNDKQMTDDENEHCPMPSKMKSARGWNCDGGNSISIKCSFAKL